jgi:3-oxoacyl-[acyl-carrier-protein] synthase II
MIEDQIAITGIGICSSIGRSAEECMERLVDGRAGVIEEAGLTPGSRVWLGRVSLQDRDDRRIAPGASHLDRTAQLALVAAQAANVEAAATTVDAERISLVFGTSHGGRSQLDAFVRDGASPETSGAAQRVLLHGAHYHQAAAVASVLGLRGAVITVSSACSSSGVAIAHACALLRSRRADLVFAGGADGFSLLTCAGFQALKTFSNGPTSPFSRRIGLSLGEGAGFVILERLEDAVRRGARVRAEIFGCGLSWDAHHITEPDPTGAGLLRAITSAVHRAPGTSAEIDYVHAHGTGTRANDAAESLALRRFFGDSAPPVGATKSLTGHTLGASSVFGLIFSILGMERGMLPPTAGFEGPRPGCDLDYVPGRARSAPVRRFLVDSAGFGGANAVVYAGRSEPRITGTGTTAFARAEIAITGLGALSAFGTGADRLVDGLRSNKSGVSAIERFPTCADGARRAGVVRDFTPNRLLPTIDMRRMDRAMQYAIVAVHEALSDASLLDAGSQRGDAGERIGLVVGTTRGAWTSFERYIDSVRDSRWERASPIHFPNLVMSSIGGQVSRALGLRGAASTIVDGTGAGLIALIEAAELLRHDDTQDAIAVVASDELGELLVNLHGRLGLLATDARVGELLRPYCSTASGMVLGEGAAAVILEPLDRARARGARIYARLSGSALTFDGTDYLSTEHVDYSSTDDGTGLARAMHLAAGDARITARELDVVYGHGRGLPEYDAREMTAIARFLAGNRVPMCCVLGSTGVAEASSGLFSAVAAARGMQHGEAYPIAGGEGLSGELDFVSCGVRHGSYHRALLVSGTASGHNAAVIMERC